MKVRSTILCTVIGVLAVSRAELLAKVNTAVIRNSGRHAAAEFSFRILPSPSQSDAGTNAAFEIVAGDRDRNGGDLDVLHDGKLPENEDAPRDNFFFAPDTEGGRLLVDLRNLAEIDQVNTYSWHPNSRGPQVYKLYASDGTAEGFDPRPQAGADPQQSGWKLITSVDSRPSDRWDEGGGQYAVSIFDSDASLGRFRYLLFDISRTDDADAFGNTFFSEIDIIAAETAADTPAGSGVATVEVDGGKYQITIDTSEAPDLTKWAMNDLAPVVQEWYPKIVKMLPSKDFEAPTQFSITFSPRMRGVAAASGTRSRGGAAWFRQNLDGEAKGAIVHELVHVVQQYGRARRSNRNATRPPGWLVEGIPDYIRWFLYEPETRGAEITARNLDRARYDASYRISGNFLNWVTRKHGKSIIEKVNAALREGTYTETLWLDLTGSTLDDLGTEWKVGLERALAGGDAAPGDAAGEEASR
jgi:Peptidase of plants and bacteria